MWQLPEVPEEILPILKHRVHVIQQITDDLKGYYPKTVLLFGSMARYLAGDRSGHFPNDIDLLVVGDNPPLAVESKDYGCMVEVNLFKIHQLTEIAKSLRYDTKPVALSKLYGKNLFKKHARDVIAACLLLGPAYNEFGIEQIEIDGLRDKRDYSVHHVLSGKAWWERICTYAKERRGPVKRFSDKIVENYEFQA